MALQIQIGRGFRGSAGRGFADGRRQRDADGTTRVPSVDLVAAALDVDSVDPPTLLSDHDVAVAADMLPPGAVGLVVVAEDVSDEGRGYGYLHLLTRAG